MPAAANTEGRAPRPTGLALERAAYGVDFFAWAAGQAEALRRGRLDDLDTKNLAAKIEDLGDEVFKELRSSFQVILTHMLKWDHQPERRSRSWAASIKTHRIDVEQVLLKGPSLHGRQGEALSIAYRQARIRAAAEMKQSERELPPDCPYTLDDIIQRPFEWPGA